MIASAATDAAIVAGVVLAGLAVLRLVLQKGFGALTIKAGPMQVDLRAIERLPHIEQKLDQVNAQVNHVEPGTPPIPQRLERLERLSEHHASQIAAIRHATSSIANDVAKLLASIDQPEDR